MTRPAGIARLERFARVGSTQAIVRSWLEAGSRVPAVALADEQTAGRGRLDRTWTAPAGSSLLLSIGLRPAGLPTERSWRVPAALTLMLLDAIASATGLGPARLRLKWPNDLVGRDGEAWRKVAGVLGEVMPDDGRAARLIVGIGLNVDWPRSTFPPELVSAMTSLRELHGGPVDREPVLAAFLERVGDAAGELASGDLDAARWQAAQLTTGASVAVDTGAAIVRGRGLPPDPRSGALRLLVAGADEPVEINAGDVVRCRLESVGAGV